MNIHRSGVLTALAWLVPQESAARESQSQRILCTPYNHAPCHFMQSHICKVYACLAVTCHLRFWQNDRGLLRATAVTRGWNGYQNKSQHRKLTLEKKFSCCSSRDLNPQPFDHECGALTTELSPLPAGVKNITTGLAVLEILTDVALSSNFIKRNGLSSCSPHLIKLFIRNSAVLFQVDDRNSSFPVLRVMSCC